MVHLHLPLNLKLKLAWPPRPKWGGVRAFSWACLPVPEVGLGGGVAMMVTELAVAVVLGGGAADYICHVPLRVIIS